jgi:hypothetical protein
MDFIAYHLYPMAKTDIVHQFQLLRCPYSATRVVRVAKQENGGFLVGTFGFEILPIHLKAVANSQKSCLKYLAAVIAY